MYAGGCLFVDAASRYVHVEMHVGLNSHETLAGKTKFERLLNDIGVGVQEYVSDNSTIFSSSAFAENLLFFQQTSHFAGVGAHHQNGVAERGIQTIMSMARTVMLHATNVEDLSTHPLSGLWQSTTLCGCTTTPLILKLVRHPLI